MNLEKEFTNLKMKENRNIIFKNTENIVHVLCNEILIADLNLESESIDEIKIVHDYILENILQYNFDFLYEGNSNEESLQFKVIDQIIISFKKEYGEIILDLEKYNLKF